MKTMKIKNIANLVGGHCFLCVEACSIMKSCSLMPFQTSLSLLFLLNQAEKSRNLSNWTLVLTSLHSGRIIHAASQGFMQKWLHFQCKLVLHEKRLKIWNFYSSKAYMLAFRCNWKCVIPNCVAYVMPTNTQASSKWVQLNIELTYGTNWYQTTKGWNLKNL